MYKEEKKRREREKEKCGIIMSCEPRPPGPGWGVH